MVCVSSFGGGRGATTTAEGGGAGAGFTTTDLATGAASPPLRSPWRVAPDVEVHLPRGASILLPESGGEALGEGKLAGSEDRQLRKGLEVLRGQIPNRDFLHLYGPGSLWVLAGIFN